MLKEGAYRFAMTLAAALHIMLGSTLLGALHAIIPSHWLPLVSISKTEGWDRSQALSLSLLVASSHVFGTLVIGLIVAGIGITFSHHDQELLELLGIVALILVGGFLMLTGIRHSHHCRHHDIHLLSGDPDTTQLKMSRWKLILSLSLAMFLSPCAEVIVYFVGVGAFGWSGVLLASVVFALVTVGIIVTLVDLSLRGIERFNWHALDHHGRTLTGALLVLLGLLNWAFGWTHPG